MCRQKQTKKNDESIKCFFWRSMGSEEAVEKDKHTVWRKLKNGRWRRKKKKKVSTLMSRIKSHLHMKSYWHNAPSTSRCSPGRHMHKRLSVLNAADGEKDWYFTVARCKQTEAAGLPGSSHLQEAEGGIGGGDGGGGLWRRSARAGGRLISLNTPRVSASLDQQRATVFNIPGGRLRGRPAARHAAWAERIVCTEGENKWRTAGRFGGGLGMGGGVFPARSRLK